jgi:2'-5' RNA ligase
LGEVEESLLPAICQDMEIVSAVIAPFWLAPGRFGAFPHAEKPRVLWIGLEGEREALKQLHLLLDKRFQLHRGLSIDRKPYRPHITLARGPHPAGQPLPLDEWDRRLLTEPAPRWQVKHVHLYRSELRPEGAVHTILHTSAFSGPECVT